jgi:hypothetical protein
VSTSLSECVCFFHSLRVCTKVAKSERVDGVPWIDILVALYPLAMQRWCNNQVGNSMSWTNSLSPADAQVVEKELLKQLKILSNHAKRRHL